MSVCVAISVCDGDAYLAQAIESVLSQEGVELELRVYDNGSTDRSVEIAHSYDDPRVVVVQNARDLTYWGSLNRALDETSAEYFAPFAADDVMLPGNLAQKVAALERTRAGFVHGGLWFIDEPGARTRLSDALDGLPDYMPAGTLLDFIVPFNRISCQTVVARSDALRSIGGFDGRCVYCGDWLAWMLLSLEHGVATVAEPLIEQRLHEDNGTKLAIKLGYHARDLPAALLRVLDHPACPAEVAGRRDVLLARIYDYCAQVLDAAGHRRLADGWAAYACAGNALASLPTEESRVHGYVDETHRAGLAIPHLPLDAVAAPSLSPPALIELAEACAPLYERGLLARLTVLVDPMAVDQTFRLLERAFARVAELPVELVPGNDVGPLLVPGRVLLAPFGTPAIAAAEAAGIPAFPYAVPSSFDDPPDQALWQAARSIRLAPAEPRPIRAVAGSRPNDFWRDRPVLVTGATGLLGSWLVPALQQRGAKVVALVRDLVPEALLFGNGAAARSTLVFGELADGALIERILAEYEIDAVFHLAAQTIVEHAQRNPLGTLRSNVEGTWELLDACRRSGRPSRIVVASSDKAYGDQPVLPYTEDTPLQGKNPYDVSKSCTDLVAQMYASAYGLPTVVTRCGNLYGGGDLNFNRLVPGTIRSALDGERPVLRSNGEGLRDYIYVEDAVEAYIALAERAHEPGIAGQAWNFSTETPASALQMTRAILDACGHSELEPDVRATATHEIENQYLSADKARRELGWRPRFTLEAGLAETVAWYRAFLAEQRAEPALLPATKPAAA